MSLVTLAARLSKLEVHSRSTDADDGDDAVVRIMAKLDALAARRAERAAATGVPLPVYTPEENAWYRARLEELRCRWNRG